MYYKEHDGEKIEYLYVKDKPIFFKKTIIDRVFISMTPSEGENKLLSQRGQSFQKARFGKRKSLRAFSRKYTPVSSLTRFSIYLHRR